MKTITELRGSFTLRPQEQAMHLRYLNRLDIDFDVYLPKYGKNLQRPLVWNINQKRELINSVFIGRHIPHLSFVDKINPEDEKENLWLIIDGKQRLTTLLDFYNNKFTVILDEKEFYYSELPDDYKFTVDTLYLRAYVVNEEWNNRITDDSLVSWFKFINFAGTDQDKEHLESFNS